MKWLRFGMITLSLLILTGCSTSHIDKDVRLNGIVDACYTAFEYNQKSEIEPYLNNKVKEGEISKETADVIIKCIERTYGDFKNE